MKNFVVLFKPVTVPNNFDSDKLYHDTVQLDFLFSKMMKESVNSASTWLQLKDDYIIDEKSISFQTIGGKLCVVMLAFRK